MLRGCFTFACYLRCAEKLERRAAARLYIKWCSRFTSQIESRAIGRFSISFNNGLCYTNAAFPPALSFCFPLVVLSFGTFSHFLAGTYPPSLAATPPLYWGGFVSTELKSLKVITPRQNIREKKCASSCCYSFFFFNCASFFSLT